MGRGWYYKTLWETALTEVVFKKDVMSPSNIKRFTPEAFHYASEVKAYKYLQQGCFFFFHYSLATPMTNWVQIFFKNVMNMLGHTKGEYWSLTITNGVQCL